MTDSTCIFTPVWWHTLRKFYKKTESEVCQSPILIVRREDVSVNYTVLIRYVSYHNVNWHPLIGVLWCRINACDCWETIYAVKIIREVCDGVYDWRKNAVVRNELSTRIAYYAHEASACSTIVKVQRQLWPCLLSTRSRDRATESGRSRYGWRTEPRGSNTGATVSPGLVRGVVFGIRTPRRVQYPRRGPAPDISLPARTVHSLPSEITAVALAAFSHVPVARVTLVVLSNERKRAKVRRTEDLVSNKNNTFEEIYRIGSTNRRWSPCFR